MTLVERFDADGSSEGGACGNLTILTRGNISPVANSTADGKMVSFNASGQQLLDAIGGEPLTGSGFENEEPESEFASTGEEN